MIRRRKRKRQHEVQPEPKTREQLEREFGQVWDTRELARDFIVIAYSKPLVQVKRKTDGVIGNLKVQEQPRLYYGFEVCR